MNRINRSGILILDKPEGLTSQQATSRVRRILGIKKAGHGGTLDPLATGVLPIFLGRATRAAGLLLDADKAYRAGFVCGVRTDTRDLTGAVVDRTDRSPTPDEVAAVCAGFVGEQLQLPPMFSALKKDGKKLYELARAGVEVEREPRRITIHRIDYLGCENGEHFIDVSCSKGTYIRTLVDDIGLKLGSFAAMKSLRRAAAGRFTLAQATPLDALDASTELLPVDSLWPDAPALTVDASLEAKVRVGNPIRFACADGDKRVYAEDGTFLMLANAKDGVLTCIKNFFEVDQ